MSGENFNYLYVTLPQVAPNPMLAQINILTPILNVDDRNNSGMVDQGDDHHHANNASDQFDPHLMVGEKTKSEVEVKIKMETDDTGVYSDPQMKKHERLQRDIMRKKMARLQETEQQRLERLQKDRERKKLSRQKETFEQRQRRLEKDRIRTQKRRAMETEEKRRRRLEMNRISKRIARLKENSSYIE